MKYLISILSTVFLASLAQAEVQCEQSSIDGLKNYLKYVRQIDEVGTLNYLSQTNDDLIFTSVITHEENGVTETFYVIADLDNQCIIDGIVSEGYEITYKNAKMEALASKYKNIFTQDDIDKDDEDRIFPISVKELPDSVVDFLKLLDITAYESGKTVIQGQGPLIIANDEFDSGNSDAFVVKENQEILGYIFNITTCDEEECYGFDALYVGPEGQLVYKSF